MANNITYVGVGSLATANGVTPTPTNPAGITPGDVKVAIFYGREVTDGTVAPAGSWAGAASVELYNERSAGGLLGVWYQIDAGEVAPTFTLGNFAAGDDCIAFVFALRSVDPSNVIDALGAIFTNTAAVDIGPIPGILLGRKACLVVVGGKIDDWTSVTDLSGDGLTWNEIGEPDSTDGNDAGLVAAYAINPGLEVLVSAKTFDVVGGSSVAGKGVMFSFALDAPAFSMGTHMPIYASQAHPVNDSAIVGGEIDPYRRLMFTDIAADDDIEVLSSSALDISQAVIVKGRNPAGALVEETKQLNGTTAVIFSVAGVMERVISVELSAVAVGTVTVRRSVAGATISTIPIGELGFRRLFANAYPNASAGKNYYEKGHLKNIHPTQTFQNGTIVESADPQTIFTFTLDAAQDDDSTAANRLTAPSTADTDPDTFDGTSKAIPGSGLDPGASIGIWFKMTCAAGEAVFKDTYSLEIAGGVSP